MKDFLQSYNIIFAIAAVGCITIVMKSIAAIVYYRLIHQSEQIGNKKSKWLKAVSGKLITTYQLRREVHNMDCIVKKCIYNMKFMGISIISWKNTGLYGICAILLLMSWSAFVGITYDMNVKWHLMHLMASVFVLFLLATSEIVFQLRRKYDMLRLQITDYFENMLLPKLEKEFLRPDEEKKYQMEYFEKEEKAEEEAAPSEEDIKIFEEIVEDYLSDWRD